MCLLPIYFTERLAAKTLIIRALTSSPRTAPRRQVTVLQADNWAPLVGSDQQGNDSYLLTARGQTRAVSNIHPERGTLLRAPAEFTVMGCILLWGRALQHSSHCFTLHGSSRQGSANLFSMQALHKLNSDKILQLSWSKVLQNCRFSTF